MGSFEELLVLMRLNEHGEATDDILADGFPRSLGKLEETFCPGMSVSLEAAKKQHHLLAGSPN